MIPFPSLTTPKHARRIKREKRERKKNLIKVNGVAAIPPKAELPLKLARRGIFEANCSATFLLKVMVIVTYH